MILLAGTALAASVGSVGAAYHLSRRKSIKNLEPEFQKVIDERFRNSSRIMGAFEQVLVARAKAKIRPMKRKEVQLMKQYDAIVRTMSHAWLGVGNERKVRAAGELCWELVQQTKKIYNPYDLKQARKAYEQLTNLEKGEMSMEYLNLLSWFMDNTFYIHARRFIDPEYRQRLHLNRIEVKFRERINQKINGGIDWKTI